jgi:Zn-dependent protease/predicted transcriptional regulator
MKQKKGVHVFTFRGIEVRLDYSWFLIFGLIVVTLGSYYFPERYPDIEPASRWTISVLSALLLFFSVLLHEFSHSITAQKLGIEIEGITLFLFGGVAQMKTDPSNPRDEFYVAAAGPFASLIIGGGLLGLYFLLNGNGGTAIEAMLWYLGELNLALVAFNMLPGFPLDGGRVARAVIWHYTEDIRRATKIVSNIGKVIAYAISGLGLLSFLGGAWAQGFLFIFLGMFLQQAADQGYRMVALREGLSGIQLGRIMTSDPHTVPSDLSIQKLVDDYFYRYRVHSFPVVDDSSTLRGHITAKQIRSTDRQKWAEMTVADAMTPVNELPKLTAGQDAYDVLQQMLQSNYGRLPVYDESGSQLAGIVTRKDIFEYVHMREEIEGEQKQQQLDLDD